MKYLLLNNENVIVAITDICNAVDNGLHTIYQGCACIYPSYLRIVQVDNLPEGIKAQKHKYTNGKFVLNDKYDNGEEKQTRKKEINEQLEIIDKKSIRDGEDLLEALIKKGILVEDDVAFMKTRRQQKQALRVELQSLN